jgi:thiol-disulfide isomerase/thioredoxin
MKRLLFAFACLLIFTGASPDRTSLQPVVSATDWLNGRATAGGIAGKVVIVDVFTVDCYNCQNVVPELRSLYARDRARGLAIVGIHAPETPAERDRSYVAQSLSRQGIVWPVAIDNTFTLWRAYGVNAWPTQLFFDRRGRLRQTIVGDSQDAEVAAAAGALLEER